MKAFFYLILCSLFTGLAFSQSLSGNLNSATNNNSLGYGNIDVYKGDKLVASVLTDKYGNFNVALDTGTYKCVVNYAGYKTETKTIRVKKDEKSDFTIKPDPKKPQPAMAEAVLSEVRILEPEKKAEKDRYLINHGVKRTEAYGFASETKADSGLDGGLGKGLVPALEGKSKALTAGEVNDFSKWNMWGDLTASVLNAYETSWNIAPKERYTVMVQSNTGMPIVDASVHLKIKNGKRIYSSKTDNTGKAELWGTIRSGESQKGSNLEIEVDYKNNHKTIQRITPFEKGINYQVLEVNCQEVENVDIAFVVDATGSMGDELSYLKEEMNDIIFQSKQISSKLNFQFANVFYRDNGVNEQYVTRKSDFTRVLSESVQYISQQSAGGGGDYPEAVETALDVAIDSLSWSKDARARILFLMLDAPPHNTPEIQFKLQRIMERAAEKGIRIVPVGASGINKSTEYLMRCLALGTNGTYTFLTSHSGIGDSHIEPSTDKYDVETLNELLVRVLKSYTYMPDCDQNLPDLQLPYADSLVVYPEPTDTIQDSIPNVPIRDTLAEDSVKTVKWSYYPNPTNGIVNVVADLDITELYVTDLSGKVLQIIKNIENNRTVQIDLGQYATGIYLIRYPLGDKWVTGKVVLQRTN